MNIVENVVLFGLPLSPERKQWRAARGVVAGRLVNGYSPKDMTLSVLLRAGGNVQEVAGLTGGKARDVEGVESVDVSSIVTGHGQYRAKLRKLMKLVGPLD